MRGPFAIGIAGCLAILGALSAVALEGNPFSLDVLWSTEIVGAPSSGMTRTFQSGTGLILSAQSMFADGRIVWLGNQIGPNANSQVLLMDVERAPPDRGAALKLKGVAPSLLSRLFKTPGQTPIVSTLAVGPSGQIWVAGLSNSYLDLLPLGIATHISLPLTRPEGPFGRISTVIAVDAAFRASRR